MASVGRNRRKDSGILTIKNTLEKGKATGRMTSTIMEADSKSSDQEDQENRAGVVTRGKLNKITELKNKMKKKIQEKKMEISDPRSRIYSGNSSFVRKKLSSLRVNNRELASTLAASKLGVRKLKNQNLGLQQENHALCERVIVLQGRVRELQAALRNKKDNEQEYKRKMSDLQTVLQKVSSSLLGTVEHIGSAMEVCHPALRDSGWRMSSLSAHTRVSASDDSDRSFPLQSRPSVLTSGAGPVRVPLPAGQRQSLAPPGSRASRCSVSVPPPPPPPKEPQEPSTGQAAPRDSIAALQSAPILFTEEGTETAGVAAPHTDVPDKPDDSSSQDTTKQVQKKDDKRSTFTHAPNTSRSTVPVAEDRRSSTLTMPPPVKVPSKSSSGQTRRGTYTVPGPVPVSTVVNVPCDSRRGTYTVPTTLEALSEVSEKRASLMDLVAEHKRKSQHATGQGSRLSNEVPAETEVTEDIYTEEDMDLTAVPSTVISTEEAEQSTEAASKETNTGRPVDKDAERTEVLKKGKTNQKDLNQSGCKPVRKLKKKKASKLPMFTKSTKTSAEIREKVEKDGHDIVEEVRNLQEVPLHEALEGGPENVEASQESEAEEEKFDVDDTTVPKPVWAFEQQQIIPENSVPENSQMPCLADDSDDDFVNKRGKRATRRIVSTDSELEGDMMITGLESSEKESSPEVAVKKKKQKGVAERNVRVSAKMTKKGLVVQSTSTKSKTSAKVVGDTTPSKTQEKTAQESVSVFDLSSGDMFSEPSPLTLKPVVSREHTSKDDDQEQSHSSRGKPKKQVKLKRKQGDSSANKKRQDVLVTESSDEEDEEENNTRKGKTSKSHKDVSSVPESPGQNDEGQISRPRRRTAVAMKYFSSDSESEDDCWSNRKSKQAKSTKRNSSTYSLPEEEENTGTQMPLRRTPQRLLQSAEKGPLSARQGRVFQDSLDNDATTPLVERTSSKRRAFQDVGNTPQGHSDTTGAKTKATPQTDPKNQKKRPLSSIGSCEENENEEDQSAGEPKRARRSRQQVSYKLPSLNSKLRRGDPMTISFGDWSPKSHQNKPKTGKKL